MEHETDMSIVCAVCDSPDLELEVAKDGILKFECNECGSKEVKLSK